MLYRHPSRQQRRADAFLYGISPYNNDKKNGRGKE